MQYTIPMTHGGNLMHVYLGMGGVLFPPYTDIDPSNPGDQHVMIYIHFSALFSWERDQAPLS